MSQSGTYFVDFSTGDTLFRDYTNVEVNLCSRMAEGDSTPRNFGNLDVMNLMWFRGAESLYSPTEGKK